VPKPKINLPFEISSIVKASIARTEGCLRKGLVTPKHNFIFLVAIATADSKDMAPLK
jgi:hypothetical protein